MIRAADIREWRNHDVRDPEGHRIGELEAVYVDTLTDLPAMVTVRTGLPTRHRLSFVPVTDAVLGPDYVEVPYDKALVKKAPSIGMDDVLPAEDEAAIFQHYDLAYETSPDGARKLARR
ncbi:MULTISPECIES: PRC-barrel domain-containing protein [unclassified Streptomyces]|uniref:PRC-barrel domain-containing protein n=1 Tax=unclassified Streptomyces TaxID=2593676 RepID=UPI0038125AB8